MSSIVASVEGVTQLNSGQQGLFLLVQNLRKAKFRVHLKRRNGRVKLMVFLMHNFSSIQVSVQFSFADSFWTLFSLKKFTLIHQELLLRQFLLKKIWWHRHWCQRLVKRALHRKAQWHLVVCSLRVISLILWSILVFQVSCSHSLCRYNLIYSCQKRSKSIVQMLSFLLSTKVLMHHIPHCCFGLVWTLFPDL